MKKILLTLALSIALVFPAISQSKVNPNKPYKTLSSEPGFLSTNEIVAGIGLGKTITENSKSFFGVTSIYSYQLSNAFVMGTGTGVLFYDESMFVPLFIDVRFRFNVQPVTPYIFEQAGVLMDFTDFISGSKVFIAGGGGAQYAFSRKLAAQLGVGLQIQSSDNKDSFFIIRGGVAYKF